MTPHPRLPLMLVCDGYMVTALQFPGEISCLGLMKGLVTESSRNLRQIRDRQKIPLILCDTLKKVGKIGRKGKQGLLGQRLGLKVQDDMAERLGMYDSPTKLVYHFEQPDEDALEGTLDTDLSNYVSPLQSAMEDEGKIMFGDVDNMNTTVDFEGMDNEENLSMVELVNGSYRALMTAWGLATSHTGLWTQHHEDVVASLVHNLLKVFTVILQANPQLAKDLTAGLQIAIKKKKTRNLKVAKVLSMLKSVLHLLRLDTTSQHLPVNSIKLVNNTISLFLCSKDLENDEPRAQTLHGCFVLLRFVEKTLAEVYTAVPYTNSSNLLSVKLQAQFVDIFQPPVLTQFTFNHNNHRVPNQNESEQTSVKAIISAYENEMTENVNSDNEKVQVAGISRFEIGRRLGAVWKLLYKHTVQQYKMMCAQVKLKKKDKAQAVHQLLVTLQCKLHTLGISFSPTKKYKVQPGTAINKIIF